MTSRELRLLALSLMCVPVGMAFASWDHYGLEAGISSFILWIFLTGALFLLIRQENKKATERSKASRIV